MPKILALTQAHDRRPFRIRADYVVSMGKQSWRDASGAYHYGTTLVTLTARSFTVEEALEVVEPMWLAALEE